MQKTVGIPRALLYYEYFPMWKTFFEYLGVNTVVSPATNQKILEDGIKNTVDEACLPVKVAMGHVLNLSGHVDYMFIPRLTSLVPREYICPKFIGFPDMVKHCLPEALPLIDININLYRHYSREQGIFREAGRLFSRNPLKINKAYQKAVQKLATYRELLCSGLFPEAAMRALEGEKTAGGGQKTGGPTVAIIGHSYNLYDRHISMNIVQNLQNRGVKVVTADNVPHEITREEASVLPKKLFWTLGERMAGAALHYMKQKEIAGIIHVVSFGCGPDSLVGELIERYLHRQGDIPFLKLTLDEHSGEAGLITRLEAFLDMIERKAG